MLPNDGGAGEPGYALREYPLNMDEKLIYFTGIEMGGTTMSEVDRSIDERWCSPALERPVRTIRPLGRTPRRPREDLRLDAPRHERSRAER